jgi:hypothetical protein
VFIDLSNDGTGSNSLSGLFHRVVYRLPHELGVKLDFRGSDDTGVVKGGCVIAHIDVHGETDLVSVDFAVLPDVE